MADNDFIVKAADELSRFANRGNTVEGATVAEQLLQEAIEVTRQRRSTYGPCTEHFKRTVGMINALFAKKLREPLTEADWAQVMICDKLARHQEKPIWDTPVDCAGYSAVMAECLKNE
jgi:hypothetical protein